MTIRTNPELSLILKKASKYDQLVALNTALTTTKRVKVKIAAAGTLQANVWSAGTLIRDAALVGPLGFVGTDIGSFGITSDLLTCLAGDLANSAAVLRIEGGGHWLEGSLGLPGSGKDFIFPTNPTTTNSIAVAGTLRLRGSQSLPDGAPDVAPPTVSLVSSSASVTTSTLLTLTATAADDVGVTRVEFLRDGVLIGQATGAPWIYRDAVTLALNGTRSYTAKAYDAAGHSTTSTAVAVTVNIAASVDTGTAIAVGSQIAPLTIENTLSTAAASVPFTIGHPFAPGHLPAAGAGITLKLSDGTVIPSQLDVKALHPDGSVRHALVSGVVPSMAGNETKTISMLRRDASSDAAVTAPTLASYVNAGMDATVSIVDGGVTYTAKVSQYAGSASRKWMTGSVANEWLITAALKDASNNVHPLLHARFYVRPYAGLNQAKIDVVVENSWIIPDPASVAGGSAWVANNPNNVTYDVTVTVPGDAGYTKTALLHYNRARWAKTFWWNGASAAHIRYSTPYVLGTKAVPNYDQNLTISSSTIAGYTTKMASNDVPMKTGMMEPSQGATGGRPDIGLHPGWCVNWLLYGDKVAKDASIRTSLLAGSFPTHYRNKVTDNWVDISVYPYATNTTGGASDDLNKVTNRHEKFPQMATASGNPNTPNMYHSVNQSYIPYLLTGDYVHLEELQAWNEWQMFDYNPNYRKFGNGAIFHQEPRGVAWNLRTLASTAYISPEGDPVKARSLVAMDYNLDYLNATHTNSADPITGNALGILHNPNEGSAMHYQTLGSLGTGYIAVAPWQDDFFTSAVGMAAEMGFTKAKSLLTWKAKFAAGRMADSSKFCWISACIPQLTVCSASGAPFFTDWADVYAYTVPASIRNTACNSQAMADACGAVFGDFTPYLIGQMVKYAPNDDGYVANGQPAFAYVADSDHPQGKNVWLVYEGRTKKQSYGSPQFAIVPRTV